MNILDMIDSKTTKWVSAEEYEKVLAEHKKLQEEYEKLQQKQLEREARSKQAPDHVWIADHNASLYAIADMVDKAQKHRILNEVIYAFGKNRAKGWSTTLSAMKALEDWDFK